LFNGLTDAAHPATASGIKIQQTALNHAKYHYDTAKFHAILEMA
jgi:hypothetical protein